MSTGFFGDIQKVRYEGPESDNPLAFRHYNADEMCSANAWKTICALRWPIGTAFAWEGGDPFGGRTFDRPWFSNEIDAAKLKADVAFEFFSLLGAPYYCFHDADVRPEGRNFAENTRYLNEIVDIFEKKQAETGMKLLWSTANLFPTGAIWRVRPQILILMSSAFAAATVKTCIDATKRLGGENYVLWGRSRRL